MGRFAASPADGGVYVLDTESGEVVFVSHDGRSRVLRAAVSPVTSRSSLIGEHPIDDIVLATFPSPVAWAWQSYLDETEARQKLRALVDAFTVLLKQWAFATSAAVFASPGLRDASLHRLLSRDLQRPLISSWRRLIELSLPLLARHGDSSVKGWVSSFERVYHSVQTDCRERVALERRYLGEDGELRAHNAGMGWVEALLARIRGRGAAAEDAPAAPSERRVQGPKAVVISGAELEVRDDLGSVRATVMDATLYRQGDCEVALHDAAVEPASGATATAEEVVLRWRSPQKFLPAGLPAIQLRGGAVTPWKRLAMTGIRGTIKADPDEAARAVIELAGGYGGVDKELWQARGWVRPPADGPWSRAEAELSLRAERFQLSQLEPILKNTPIIDADKTAVDASLELKFGQGALAFGGSWFDKKGKRDSGWRTKTLLGKVFLAVLLYPVSAPLALGVAASGGVLHLLLGMPTFAECEDQAKRRQRQLLKRGDKPLGRFTHLGPKDLAIPERTEGTDTDKGRDEEEADEPAQEDAESNLAAKLTDPDVLNAYSRATELAWERLVQQGHIPPNVRPVINDAMVREVESVVREAQKQKAG